MSSKDRLRKTEEIDDAYIAELREFIDDIKNDRLSHEELVECLEMKQLYVLSNVFLKIIKFGIVNQKVIDSLSNLTQYRDKRYIYSDIVALGHFAMAALFVLDKEETLKKYNELLLTFNSVERESVDRAIIVLKDLTK